MKSDIKEIVANLLNAPDRVKFRELLQNNLEEYNELEFKGDYIKYDKLAKHILAMANTNNSLIIFGVDEEDNKLNPIGIELKDKTDIKNGLKHYLPDSLEYEIHDFKYGNEPEWKKIKNKDFQMITIRFTPDKIPFLSKIEKGVVKPFEIYCRRSNSSEKVRQEDIERILNARINSSTNNNEFNLEKELNELKILNSYNNPLYQLLFVNDYYFIKLVKKFEEKKIKLIEKELGIDIID